MQTLKVGRQTAEIEVEGRTFRLKEHTAAQVDHFQELLTAMFAAPPAEEGAEGLTPAERALAALLAFLLGKDLAGETPDADWLLANVTTRMALQIVDAQTGLNSYEEILGNLMSRSKPAASQKN